MALSAPLPPPPSLDPFGEVPGKRGENQATSPSSVPLCLTPIPTPQNPEEQNNQFQNLDQVKRRPAHLMALLQHVAMQFEPGPLVRAGPGRHGGGAGRQGAGLGPATVFSALGP